MNSDLANLSAFPWCLFVANPLLFLVSSGKITVIIFIITLFILLHRV